MESALGQTIIMVGLDILIWLGLFTLWVKPRFNHWPATDIKRFNGKPHDYIHDHVFLRYAVIYFGIYTILAFAITHVPELYTAFKEGITGQIDSDPVTGLFTYFETSKHKPLFPIVIIFIIAICTIVPLSKVDQAWRSKLLESARIPKEAIRLMDQINDGLTTLNLSSQLLQPIYRKLNQDGDSIFWNAEETGSNHASATNKIRQQIVKCFYLVDLNYRLDSGYPSTEDLKKNERRLKEIASVAPNINEEKNANTITEYSTELDVIVKELTEMLARNYIKKFPTPSDREKELARNGFELKYVDNKEFHLHEPALWMSLGALVVCVASIVIFLAIFDGMGIQGPGKSEKWFDLSRIVGWSIGGSLSYVLAVIIGLFFSEALPKKDNKRNLTSYPFAFLLSMLSSMLFFLIAKDEFKSPHIWLTVSFGLLAIVVIAARGKNLASRTEVRNMALIISLAYALASGILQIMIRVGFNAYTTGEAYSDVDFAALSLPTFFAFGFFRGLAIAFLVSYILLDYQRQYSVHPRRSQRRIPFDDLIEAKLAGKTQTLIVRNLSEHGALLKLAKGNSAALGDAISLKFPFGEIAGQVLSVVGRNVRISFDLAEASEKRIQHFINQEVEFAT